MHRRGCRPLGTQARSLFTTLMWSALSEVRLVLTTRLIPHRLQPRRPWTWDYQDNSRLMHCTDRIAWTSGRDLLRQIVFHELCAHLQIPTVWTADRLHRGAERSHLFAQGRIALVGNAMQGRSQYVSEFPIADTLINANRRSTITCNRSLYIPD